MDHGANPSLPLEPHPHAPADEQGVGTVEAHDGVAEDDFVAMRTKRDATLEMPVLILPSVQVNIRAGEMPPQDANGVSYLRIPVNAL